MPHLTLRHSSNLKDADFLPFFQKAHMVLCELLNVKSSSCSSMVTPHQQYLIGDGEMHNAFVHLDVLVKAERYTKELLKKASQSLFNELSHYLALTDASQAKASVDVFETSYFSN